MLFSYFASYVHMFDFYGRTDQATFWRVRVMDWLILVCFVLFPLFDSLADIFMLFTYPPSLTMDFLLRWWNPLSWYGYLYHPWLLRYFGMWYLSRLLPGMAISVRRLHDVGKTGYLYFLNVFFPIIGSWWLLHFYTMNSVGPTEES